MQNLLLECHDSNLNCLFYPIDNRSGDAGAVCKQRCHSLADLQIQTQFKFIRQSQTQSKKISADFSYIFKRNKTNRFNIWYAHGAKHSAVNFLPDFCDFCYQSTFKIG